MNKRGRFILDRAWFNHPAFEPEPYTEREAWAWMIADAAYKPHKVPIGGHVLELQRGQIARSTPFLADKWKWHRSRVRRFLDRLRRNDMIGQVIGQGADQGADQVSSQIPNLISIINYEAYQLPLKYANQPTDQGADQVTDQVIGQVPPKPHYAFLRENKLIKSARTRARAKTREDFKNVAEKKEEFRHAPSDAAHRMAIQAKKQRAVRQIDKDRSNRPTYQELIAKFGPTWGLKKIEH